jgi:hypothetical protein
VTVPEALVATGRVEELKAGRYDVNGLRRCDLVVLNILLITPGVVSDELPGLRGSHFGCRS